MKPRIKDTYCIHCGHPVMAEGVTIYPCDDSDRVLYSRERCADTACESAAVARYEGSVLVAVEGR